jgi:hypothetical protein
MAKRNELTMRAGYLVPLASLLTLSLALTVVYAAAGANLQSEKSTGAFATGKYRNLFVEAGHSEAEGRAKISAAPFCQGVIWLAWQQMTRRRHRLRCGRT